MKIFTKLLFFCFVLFLCGFAGGALAIADSANVNLDVTGTCNYNGVCEPELEESELSCLEDCGAVWGDSGTKRTDYIESLYIKSGFDSAEISWRTTSAAQCAFYWGETSEYGKEIFSETSARENHSVDLADLQSSALYHFRIICKNDPDPDIDSKDQTFETLSFLKNVSNFITVAGDKKIYLSWQNPDDGNFDSVVLRRGEDFFPLNINQGALIYQGPENLFEDTGLVNGKTYYYSIFALGKNNEYSSGAVAMATPQEPEAATPSLAFSPAPSALPTFQPSAPSAASPTTWPELKAEDFRFFVNGRETKIKSGLLTAEAGDSIVVSTDCQKFISAKAVLLQINHSGRAFLYILKPEGEEKKCSVSFSAPQETGSYFTKIFSIDEKNKTVQEFNFYLNILEKDEGFKIIVLSCTTWVSVCLIFVLILLVICLLLLARRRAEPEEERPKKS